MNVLGQKLLHAMGEIAKLVPFAIAAVSAIVGGLGAGASTPAIVGPFAFVMAATAGVNPVLTAIAITFLSFFSSSTSTVMPLMYPMVPALASGLGLNPIALYTCNFFGGLATSCSPFSTGGAVCIAANPYEDQKELLSNKMIIIALIIPLITIVAAEAGLFNIFGA